MNKSFKQSKVLNQLSKKFLTGFTLIETLLALGLTTSLLFLISLFLTSSYQARIKNEAILEVNQQGLFISQIINQSIRNADNIISPSKGISNSQLSLDVYLAEKDPVIFNLDNGVVKIKEGAADFIALTNSHVIIENLSFTNLSKTNTPGIIRYQFSIKSQREDRAEYAYQKTYYGSASLR